jgi:hypothetical protein
LFNNWQNSSFIKGKIMEQLEDKYYKTIGKNIALELGLDLPQEMWLNLGSYAWMVTNFVQAERNRDLREAQNK